MYSEEHLLYLKRKKRKTFWIRFSQIMILVIFLLTWQFLADKKLINTFITSSPKEVVSTIFSLQRSGNLWNHIWVTTYETLISFFLGTILGVIIAAIFWYNKFIAKVLDPYLTVLNSLPKVALGPIIIIWAGASMKSIIIMALLISIFVMIINVYDGFKNTDSLKINLLKSLKATKWQVFVHAVFRGNFNTIISSLKVCISMSLIGVIMGEFLVSKEGLGYLIMYGSQVFNLNLVMTGILLLCLLAIIMYSIVCYIEKKLIKYD